LVALPEVEVVVTETWPATVRSPDLVVVRRELAVTSPVRYRAGDVLLAVEVISPASRKTDEFAKLYEYSDVGIPHYWILDLDGRVTSTAYHLVDGEYEIVGRGSGSIPLTEPAAVTVDVGGLLPHRA
jgi:Uma2 family endonuclease